MDETLMMGSVGPDDDFSSNVVPFTGNGEKKQKREVLLSTVGDRKISNMIEVMEDDEKLTYLIDGLLPDTGLLYIGGLSGTGKTILAIQIAVNIVLGQPIMTWQLGEAAENARVLMLSLEMSKKELQQRLLHMYPSLTDDEKKVLEENFLTYSEAEPFELWNSDHILELTRILKRNEIDILLIDSASVSFGSSLKDDVQVNESIKNLFMLRSRMDVAMIAVAHTRKPPPGIVSNPEDVTLNELFGHSGVAQSASSILIMLEDEKLRKETIRRGQQEKTEKKVHIVNAKSRFGANSGAFSTLLTSQEDVENGESLCFRRNAIPIAMTEDQKRKLRGKKGPSMKEALKDIDFSSLVGDDDE